MRVTAVLAGVWLAAAAATARADVVDRVLASVGGRIVTLSDVRAARELGLVPDDAAAADSRAVLERLIDRILILDEVERYAPPEPHANDIRAGVDRLRSRFGDDEAFAAALKTLGTDEATVTLWVRNDLRIDAYLTQRFASVVEPTGEDLERYVREVDVAAERSGRTLPDDEVKRLARERAVAERRQALIREWIEGLRRRVSISYTQTDH
jgi:hypothetical protein